MITTLDPRTITTYSRQQIEEQLMALVGRHADNPRKFRDWMRSLSDKDLAEHLDNLMEQWEV